MSTPFVPKHDFFCEETKSQYVQGMSYRVVQNRKGHDKLAERVKRWVAEGKVVLGGAAHGVSGTDERAPTILERIKSWL